MNIDTTNAEAVGVGFVVFVTFYYSTLSITQYIHDTGCGSPIGN